MDTFSRIFDSLRTAAPGTRIGTVTAVGAASALAFLGYHNLKSYLESRVCQYRSVKIYLDEPKPDGSSVRLHYRLTGTVSATEPLVVFVSGTGWPLNCWKYIQEEVAKDFSTLSYDRVGLSSSDYSPIVHGRKLVSFAQELRALISALGHKGPLILVGHSFGAAICRIFAVQYPEVDIRSIVLIDGVCEDMHELYPELAKPLSTGAAKWVGMIMGRLPMLRVFNALGLMWKMITSHPGSDILVNNKVAREGFREMARIMTWPRSSQTMLAEISTMGQSFDELRNVARKQLLSNGRAVVSIVCDKSVGMIVPPTPEKWPSWAACQRKFTAVLNGVSNEAELPEDRFLLVPDSNHSSILASAAVVAIISREASKASQPKIAPQ